MKLDLYQIDAFADAMFTGNPAAIVPLTEPLGTDLMQNIALENNLSETGFIVASDRPDRWDLRFFTPTTEVPLCGHATFASGVCVLRHLHPELDKVSFNSPSGVLTVERDGNRFIVNLPVSAARDWVPSAELKDVLGVPVVASGGSKFPFIVVENVSFVRGLNIETGVRAAKLTSPGELIIAAPGDGDLDFVVRVFVPGVGIDEDPVTGAAFAQITAYWAKRLGKQNMQAEQASKRSGLVAVELRGDRVLLGGGANDFMRGQIVLP
ncbi:MAG: isomerase [Robiginitomaculum sp.]|nr:MAG: isomerase [Robiginitomaculum sp.]